MADRTDYFFKQKVTEAELDLAFELLEKADRNLAADIGVYGIISGAEPTPHSPVPDLTIDLSAPGRAYDNLGQRIFFGSGQIVDCSVDHAGLPTEVPVVDEERWLGVFLRFDRLLSDPRTDGNSQQVFFRREESFEVVVRQGPTAATDAAPKVPLNADELLICDVHRTHGQAQILPADIDTSRRQAFIFAQGDAVEIADHLDIFTPAARQLFEAGTEARAREHELVQSRVGRLRMYRYYVPDTVSPADESGVARGPRDVGSAPTDPEVTVTTVEELPPPVVLVDGGP